jgi:hypothetical protein
MDQNQTRDADPAEEAYYVQVPWEYKLLRHSWQRICVGTFFTAVHTFILVAPLISARKNSDGSTRRIPTWNLPAAVLTVYAFGAIWAMFLAVFSPRMTFHTSGRANDLDQFVKYSARRWIVEYPTVRSIFGSVCFLL